MHYIGKGWRGAAAVAVASALTAVGACSGDARLTVSAASSLRDVVHTILGGARVNSGGSDLLATQIAEGAPVDLFVSASPQQTDRLAARRLVDRPVAIATNRLVLVMPAGSTGGPTSLDDLRRPGLRLVLAQPSVPVGSYARRALAALDLTGALRNLVSNEESVAGVLAKVRLGEADAGIVYATDAQGAGDAVRTLAIPVRAQPRIVVTAAVVAGSRHSEQARRALAELRGERGRRALAAAGFGPAPPSG